MTSKSSNCLVLLCFLLASATLALGKTDPELKQCRNMCYAQRHSSPELLKRCLDSCEREREHDFMIEDREREEMQGEQGRENPYVFEDRHFITGLQSQHGRLRILPKFTERSELLRGIENYRVTIFEAEPQTFVVPSYWDADAVYFVANGRGTVNSVRQDRKESYSIKQGDVVRTKAGTTTYLINSDNNQKLILAKVLIPVNTPGEFQSYFGGGGDNPESFYKAFSSEILQAAFNTESERVQRLFGQQKQGFIIKASEEQIKSLSRHEEGGMWPFGGESKSTFNLYQQRPTHSNQYGQLYEVDSSQFRQLRDLDMSVSLANITQGAMTAPYYNSKATKIAIVVEGEGYFEMACPHISQSQGGGRQEQEEQGSRRETSSGPRYQRVSSRLRRGTVVVVPAGHPFVAVASNNHNLQLVCFEVNARDNEKFPLAGRRNVMNQLEKEAKELSFGMPAKEVDEVFRSQKEEFFFKGPRRQQQQQQGRADE